MRFLHLLYSRFFARAMKITGHLSDVEDRSRACSRRAWWSTRPIATTAGAWVQPAEIRIEGQGDSRKAIRIEDGAPIEIGSIEKMSKSKKNVVDPDDIIASYGRTHGALVHAVRFASGTRRDLDRGGVCRGLSASCSAVWRLTNEVADMTTAGYAAVDSATMAVMKAAHKALAEVERSVESLGFNKAVAFIYTLLNELEAGLKAGASRVGMVKATSMMVQMIAPMMPHLAEECWTVLGHDGMVAASDWPVLDASLLVASEITLPVQVNGKKRADVTVAASATPAEVEAAVRALEAVTRACEGKPIRKVIVVPGRIVNVVV